MCKTWLEMAFFVALGANIQMASAQGAHDHHTGHGAKPAAMPVQRTLVDYKLPDMNLVRQDGKAATLKDAVEGDYPVYVNFIFTTCTTVCPVMAQTFAQVNALAQAANSKVRFVSVSIDPLEDTPAKLTAYGKKFDAGSNWQFYTGTAEASIAAQKAFNVYRGDKMNHPVAAFFRRDANSPWVRIEGFASPQMLFAELSRKD